MALIVYNAGMVRAVPLKAVSPTPRGLVLSHHVCLQKIVARLGSDVLRRWVFVAFQTMSYGKKNRVWCDPCRGCWSRSKPCRTVSPSLTTMPCRTVSDDPKSPADPTGFFQLHHLPRLSFGLVDKVDSILGFLLRNFF